MTGQTFRTRLRLKGASAKFIYAGGVCPVPVFCVNDRLASVEVPYEGRLLRVEMRLPGGRMVDIDPPGRMRSWASFPVKGGDVLRVDIRPRWLDPKQLNARQAI
jgi:hypothetical protein